MAMQEGRRYGTGRKCNALSVTDAAYIAGLIDGEGCIGISYRKATEAHKVRFQPVVGINLTRREPLDWLVAVSGLSTVTGPHRNRDLSRAPLHRWMTVSSSAATLLEQIVPYLKIKRANAELLIRTDSDLRADGSLVRNQDWIETLKAQFHRLNAKGPRVGQTW